VNFAKHRNNPNMPFWKMLKEGYDHFEVTRQEPKVDFCEHKYVFDAAAPAGSTRPLKFDASAKCPAYSVPADIADAVREKDQKDQTKLAELISKGTPVARLRTGIDGGMHQVFASKIPDGSTGLSEADENSISLAMERAPGTIPPTVNPPRPSDNLLQKANEPTAVAAAPVVSQPPRIASASKDDIGGLLSGMSRRGGSDTTASTPAPPSAPPQVITARRNEPVSAPPRPQAAVPKPADAKHADSNHTAKPQLKPSVDTGTAKPATTGAISGAAPVVSSNNFDSRFSAFR
jgi:hypothetical protein